MEQITSIIGHLELLAPVALTLLALLVVLITHELGHLVTARCLGLDVLTLSIGVGPELAGYTDRSGMRWKLCLVPCAAYVQYRTAYQSDDKERSKIEGKILAWKEAFTIAGGPLASFLLAFVILFTLAIMNPTAGYLDVQVVQTAPIAGMDAVNEMGRTLASIFRYLSALLTYAADVHSAPSTPSLATRIQRTGLIIPFWLHLTAIASLLVAILNVIPLHPLDGARFCRVVARHFRGG